MKSKDVLAHFVEASWRATSDLNAWTSKVGPQPPPVIDSLLNVIIDEEAHDDRHAARRQTRRIAAAVTIIAASVGPALFPILCQAISRADPALRQALYPQLLACNDPAQHPRLVAMLDHKDSSVRILGAEALRALKSPTAFPHLVDAVKNPRLAGRKDAVDLICEFGGARALTALVVVIRQGRDDDRAHAVSKLNLPQFTERNLRPILETLRTLFADSSDAVVVRAVEIYSTLCDAQMATENLVPGLRSPRISVVQAIVRSLARFPSPKTLTLLEDRFAAGPLSVRLAVLETCEAIGDDRVVPIVFDALASGQFAVREAAAGILSRLANRDGVDIHQAIEWLLRNPEASVRRRAVEVAYNAQDPENTLWRKLLPALSDPDWWVRERVVDVITARGGEGLTVALGQILKTAEPVARVYAVDICERLQTKEALALLIDCAQTDSEIPVRDRAVEGLGVFADHDGATMAVVKALRDHSELRRTAVDALASLNAIESAPLVAEHLGSQDASLVDACLRALDKFDDDSVAEEVERCLTHQRPRLRDHAAELLKRWAAESAPRVEAAASDTTLDDLLRSALSADASTIVLAGGARPLLKHMGASATIGEVALSAERVTRLILPLLTAHQRSRVELGYEVDASYAVDTARFRVHVFAQRQGLTAVFQRSQTGIEELATLGLPPSISEVQKWKHGLVVLAGDPHSGRSTTLHALVDRMNASSTRHVIMLCPSLEVIHTPKRSVVTQREIGAHAANLELALRASLRQDPDVITLDDVPGEEALPFALSAAETGHLVICTLNAQSAADAVERLLAKTPPEEKEHARAKMATTLRAVIYQRLLPRIDGNGRVVASELLLRTPAVANLIRKGKFTQLQTAITTGQKDGMVTLERDMERLVQAGLIAGR